METWPYEGEDGACGFKHLTQFCLQQTCIRVRPPRFTP
jgi:hypothetical protein